VIIGYNYSISISYLHKSPRFPERERRTFIYCCYF